VSASRSAERGHGTPLPLRSACRRHQTPPRTLLRFTVADPDAVYSSGRGPNALTGDSQFWWCIRRIS